MEFVLIGQHDMDFKKEIHNVLFDIGKDIKIHKVDKDNMIIEIDYDKYTEKLIQIFKDYCKCFQSPE